MYDHQLSRKTILEGYNIVDGIIDLLAYKAVIDLRTKIVWISRYRILFLLFGSKIKILRHVVT